ncbi:MAG: hypothetical protein VB137_09865 [Burkholderia sp.]
MAKRTQEAQNSQAAETAIKGLCGLDELIRQGARQVTYQAIAGDMSGSIQRTAGRTGQRALAERRGAAEGAVGARI